MLILGLNMFHADASAAIVQDGEVVFAIAEGIAADYTAIFERVLHITQVALRSLRNNTGRAGA